MSKLRAQTPQELIQEIVHSFPNFLGELRLEYSMKGLAYVTDEMRQMSKIVSLEKTTVVFDREDASSPYLNTNYLCSMNLVNNFGMSVLLLKFNEIDATIFVDNLIQFRNMNMGDLIVPVRFINQAMVNYQAVLERDPSNHELIKIKIMEYHPFYETLTERISFTVDEKIYDDMLYCMYFSWIIDLDYEEYNALEKLVDDLIVDDISTEFYQ